ncbi:MAG: trypsin-like serine protease, partial [Nitrospinota bacterium]
MKKDLVLTAGHGLDKEQVRVRMVGRFEKGQKEWLDADVIWNGENGEEQQIDAAILKLSEPVTDIAPCPEQRRTDAGETWKGLGFPGGSTTQIGERTFRDTRELGGTYREGGGMRGGTLQLTEPSEIKDKEKWKGISGAPVLVDGVLVGIVKSVDDQFKTTEFAGVPLEKILEFEKVKEFWKRVDEEGKNFFEKVRRETIADLEKCSGLFAALAAKEKLAEGKKSPEKM